MFPADYDNYKMYNSNEFGQDSPRYTSQGTLYADSHYIDSNIARTGSEDARTGSGGVQPSYSGYAPPQLAQPTYSMHLPHNPRIFPMDQSVSNYSSNPPMSINLPPPLTDSTPGWTPGVAPVSPHFTADPNPGIHMPAPEQQRLDDAIDVLRDLGPVDPHGGIYSHISSSQLDPLTSPPSAVTVTQCQGSYPGLTPTPNIDDSIKRERLPVMNAEKRIDLLDNDSKMKLSRGKLVAAGVIWDDTVDSTSQRKGTKRSRRSSCSSAHEDCDDPDIKREEERRQAKNVSERERTRELNEIFKKLANKYSDQSQTKLNVLSMVVEIINKLEQQVTEQHPSVSIEEWRDFWLDLRRKEEAKEEEERASDGPNLPGYLATHIAYPHSHLLAHFQSLFPTLFGPQSSLQHNPPQPQ